MRKIIDGKAYDTSTAEELCSWIAEVGRRDFHWCEETLYRTKNGRYFIYGEGGPASRWARDLGDNSYSEGRDLVLLTEAEARKWGERHMSADQFEDVFGEVEEG